MDAGMDTESPSVTIETDEQSVSLAPMTNQEGLAPSAAMATSNQLELQFLSEAHVYLGSGGQGWCARDGGCFLKTMVLRLREELRVITAHSPQTREASPSLTPSLPLPLSHTPPSNTPSPTP